MTTMFITSSVTCIFRHSRQQLQNVGKLRGFRCLYSKSSLGIDGFLQQQQRIQSHLTNIEERFRNKMKEYAESESKNIIFTEDLKNMIYISQNDDIELVIGMLKRFNQQNKQLRFGNFVFGPVVMRMFHVLNRPDEALECFRSPELDGFFDQLMSYQLLFDLLYENGRYKDILANLDLIKNKQIEGSKFPKNIVVLTLAACYKLNSKESLEFALKLWSDLAEVGHAPTRRSATFCAGIALNQGEPAAALEILSCIKNQSYTTVRNLKVAVFLKLGRTEDVIPLLKSILNQDQIHTFNKDVLENVALQIKQLGNTDIEKEFNHILKYFQEQGHISERTLDEQLCTEITVPQFNNQRQYTNIPRHRNYKPDAPFRNRQHPSLHDM